MRLDLLAQLNTERAARRAAILVTDIATNEQRFVRESEAAADPLATCWTSGSARARAALSRPAAASSS